MATTGDADLRRQTPTTFRDLQTSIIVEPLERSALWETGEVAETYPSGL